MRLNTISAALGHKTAKRRVGRGIGSGLGKTCGKGHKGQKARKSGNVRPGFEGGQMPLQKRLPKYGFVSRQSLTAAEVRTHELNVLEPGLVSLEVLQRAGVIGRGVKTARIFLAGEISKKFDVSGLAVSSGARRAIEAAGGTVGA